LPDEPVAGDNRDGLFSDALVDSFLEVAEQA